MAQKQNKQRTINADIKRAQYLACCIYPGEAFLPDENTDNAKNLLELLTIIAKYDSQDDRDYLIYCIGEAIYPTTFEGQGSISAFVERAGATQGRGA